MNENIAVFDFIKSQQIKFLGDTSLSLNRKFRRFVYHGDAQILVPFFTSGLILHNEIISHGFITVYFSATPQSYHLASTSFQETLGFVPFRVGFIFDSPKPPSKVSVSLNISVSNNPTSQSSRGACDVKEATVSPERPELTYKQT